MSRPEPSKRSVDWSNHTFEERVRLCLSVLAVHGFLSDSEIDKAKERINKWLQKAEPQ